MKKRPYLILACLFLSGLFIAPELSFASVGKAKMVLGKVMLISKNGAQTRLRRGNKVNVGDTILTSKRGQAQLTMIDGTKISIRPASKFQIEQFIATGRPKDQKTYYKLLKGGFRSVTGNIGKRNKASFRLSTPVATMGIRGTDFTGKYCNDDCPASAGKNGLFVDVISGKISMTNDGGSIDLDKESNGYVSGPNDIPITISELPDNLLSPKAKKTNDRKNKKNKRKKYPSPEEEMVQIGLYIDPGNTEEILTAAIRAGVPPAQIMRGADSAGLRAKDFIPHLIKEGKKRGLSPSDFVAPILESGIDADNAISNLMINHPKSASDILTAAIATGAMDKKIIKEAARRAGVDANDIEAADVVGDLFALPPVVKKILEDVKNKNNHDDDERSRAKSDGERSQELNPSTDDGSVASPA